MKVKKVLIPFIITLVLLAAAPVMAAPAAKTPLTLEARFIPGNVSQGKLWITEDGIRHAKGAISEGTITGNIPGTFRIVHDEVLDLNTGQGVNHGKFVLTADEGTFEGSFRSVVMLDSFSGTFVGHGTGVYEGKKITGSYEGRTILDTIPVVVMELHGIMLSPKG